jgi:hypothetical protein
LKQQCNYKDVVLWDKVRNLEFASYNTAFAGMSGERPFKKVRKPTDLYRLPTDNKFSGPIKIDKTRAKEDVNLMKDIFKWHKKDSINNN